MVESPTVGGYHGIFGYLVHDDSSLPGVKWMLHLLSQEGCSVLHLHLLVCIPEVFPVVTPGLLSALRMPAHPSGAWFQLCRPSAPKQVSCTALSGD